MTNIRIEKVGDVSCTYPYLEVFRDNETSPFLEIGITEGKDLSFKIYPVPKELVLTVEQWEQLLAKAKDFLPEALKDEDDFQRSISK